MPNNKSQASTVGTMLAIVAVVFVAEFLMMAWLESLDYLGDSVGVMLLDAGLLAVIVALPVYWLVRAREREYGRRLRAESEIEDLGRLAITDALTHIMNRRGITVALLDAMAQAERYDAPLSVGMADIDHFKQINDTYGHEAGDKALTGVAAILSETLRMPDKVGRYGGEEFLIVLPHTALAAGRKITERLRSAVGRGELDINDHSLRLTISIGLTQVRKGEDLEQVLSRVDKALYAAKTAGRNLVVARKKA